MKRSTFTSVLLALLLAGCATVHPPAPAPDPNWQYRWTENPRQLLACSPQRAVLEERWYLDRSCEVVDIRVILMADGTIIWGKCGGSYPGAVYDTMPPGGPCLDWEMKRAGSPRERGRP